MEKLTAVVLGATGLIGEQVVQQLLVDPAYSKVRILVRRQADLSHTKLETEVVNFDDLIEFRNKLGRGDCIFCCVGTTNNKVKGDKTAYRKVDFDIPVNAAKMGKEAGFSNYLLVSAVGANPAAFNFYLKLKGEAEQKIADLKFTGFHVFRPGILLGKRKEFRMGESIAKVAMKVLSVLFIGTLKKYKGIEGLLVAKAMITAAKSGKKGMFIHQYTEMITLANTSY